MKHARVAFVVAILLNLAWIAFGSWQNYGANADNMALLTVAPSVIAVVAYHLYLHNCGQFLTQRDIDSVYYLGFLVTLMVLAAAAYQVATYVPNAGQSEGRIIPAIGLKFGLGLLATGYGLFGRIMLQSKLLAPEDATKAIEDYVDGIGRLNDRINTSSAEIERLLDEVLKSAAETSKKASSAAIDAIAGELDPAVRKLSDAITQLNDVAEALGKGPLTSLTELAEEVSIGFGAMGREVPAVTQGLSSLATFSVQAATAQSDLAQASVSTGESVREAGQAIETITKSATPAGEQVKLFAEQIRLANASFKSAPKAAEALAGGLQAAIASVQSLDGSMAQLVSSINLYQQALATEKVTKFGSSLENAAADAGKLSAHLGDLSKGVTSIGTEFSADIGASAKTIRELATSMGDTSTQLGQAMERLAVEIRNAARQIAPA